MFSIFYNIVDKVKLLFRKGLRNDTFDFSTPVPKGDKDFWKGVSFSKGELSCIIHLKTNLLINYDGKLMGRFVKDEVIPFEDLDPKIIQWYKDCGFDIEQV